MSSKLNTHSDCKYDNNSSLIDTVSGNEIITLCVGKAGIFMGNSFYSTIMNEHKIGKNGKFIGDVHKNNNDQLLISKINTYFKNDKKENKYIPRAFFVDIDKSSVNKIRSSPIGSLIDDGNLFSSSFNESTVIWPKGHYIEGALCIDNVIDKIGKEIEICDYFQGWNMMHSLSGGWGSGFGTLLLLKLRDNYPDKQAYTLNIYPSIFNVLGSQSIHSNHNTDFAVYNAILALHQILENTDLNFGIDNGVLMNICKNQCKLTNSTYDDINWLISLIFSGITSTFRFHTEPTLNANLKGMCTNLTCYPRINFMAIGHSPFFLPYNYKYNGNIIRIIDAPIANVTPIQVYDGLIWNYMSCYRSNDEKAINKMNKYVSSLRDKRIEDFVGWIPNNVHSCIVYDGNSDCYDKYTALMSTRIVNTTAIKTIFQRLGAQFAKLFKRRSSIHWYRGEGMDEMEFMEADKNVRDLITEYQDKQGRTYFDDFDDYEDDDSVDDSDDDEEDEDEDESSDDGGY